MNRAINELVAELTSAFLCAELAIPGRLRHPEYIAHWVAILKEDTQAIWTAGAPASEAAAYLVGLANADATAFDDNAA